MAFYNFDKDIETGTVGERILYRYLITKYNATYVGKSEVTEGNHKEFDLKFTFPSTENEVVVFEVKNDNYIKEGKTLPNGAYYPGRETGNIVIEFKVFGKPSGINVTTSDWWVYIFEDKKEIWFIKVDELKKLISENDFEIKVGGDKTDRWGREIPQEMRSHMYAIPRKKFRNYFKVKVYDPIEIGL
jgi:hypothetical protein